MAADIQRVRWALAKVEEKFNENPNFAVGNTVMKQLLDLYKVFDDIIVRMLRMWALLSIKNNSVFD